MVGQDGTSLPHGVVVQDSGTENSMSFDDTNKVRASLGLPPLKAGKPKPKKPEVDADALQREAAAAAKTDELREKLEHKRAQREMESKLQSVKPLGSAAHPGEDDLMAWVSKSRELEKQKARELEQRLNEQEAEEEEGEAAEEEGADSAALAGMRVKHDAEEMAMGHTSVLTFEDTNILDDQGNLNEEGAALEESSMMQEKDRERALRAATKVGVPLFGEDGVDRPMLSKYDEEAAGRGMVLDATGGAAAAAEDAAKEEVARKLQSAAVQLGAGPQVASDFYTPAEMEVKFSKKKKRVRKVRKRAKDADDPAADAEDLAATIAALEAQVAAEDGADLGSRSDRAAREVDRNSDAVAQALVRKQKYAAALAKAVERAAVLRQPDSELGNQPGRGAGGGQPGVIGEDAEDEGGGVAATAEQARRAAASGGATGAVEALATEMGVKREEDEEKLKESLAAPARAHTQVVVDGKERLTHFDNATQFVSSINRAEEGPQDSARVAVKAEEGEGAEAGSPTPAADEDGDTPMGEAGASESKWRDASAAPGSSQKAPRNRSYRKKEPGDQTAASVSTSITQETKVGLGLGGALALLKSSGALNQGINWAGRTNDKKAHKLAGLEDVYKRDGSWQDSIERSVDVALTRKDEFGRQLTPKDAFRKLCYEFHGIQPSKNKQERRIKQLQEEVKQQKQAGSNATTSGALEAVKKMQATTASSHIRIDGAGGMSSSLLKATGGALTPLTGKRKVEAMLGIPSQAGGKKGKPPHPPGSRLKHAKK